MATPRRSKAEEIQDYAENYLPIRYAGPLTAKLAKRYWEQPAVVGLPLVFAIQDFHDEVSMAFSEGGLVATSTASASSTLWLTTARRLALASTPGEPRPSSRASSRFPMLSTSLCGHLQHSRHPRQVHPHGHQVRIRRDGVHVVHAGRRLDLSSEEPAQLPFSSQVEVDYPEDWLDGMDVFHNPKRVNPLDPELIPGAAHHILTPDGDVTTLYPDGHLLASRTSLVVPCSPEK